ncbi:MAG TPA: hypothetical protein VMI75_37490 [Polyangiaceae bacterium]|nr:hypothetical protein [Polyangiaceae bacterium]
MPQAFVPPLQKTAELKSKGSHFAEPHSDELAHANAQNWFPFLSVTQQ